ncbi:sugar-binding transcriptional regulator [Bacillus sp. 03113]|uniref:sugar-binding transcriptional regulator n=1 Tax=Bacillus sp. 03113 TaxID=2578211 RepID=UPI0011438ED3|nr:sugar-binding transcriptional regulator [Bacillus sp. 03113]
MKSNEEKKLLIKIAQMYYEKDMTQNQIANELGIYRTTISRMLKKVREEGIVKITINYDSSDNFTIEQKLKERFGLKEAIVVPVGADQPSSMKLKAMGQACAGLLDRVVNDEDVIGFSWGSSLAAVIEELQPSKKKDVMFVPMVGGPSGRLNSKYHVNTICYQAALKFHAHSLMIDVPAIVEKKSTRNDLLASPHIQEITGLWNKITVAVFGIGSLEIAGKSTWHTFYGDSVIEELEDGRVVGDICSRFFDENGVPVQTALTERTITINLNQIKKARYSIGVAESLEKVPGIIGALKGGYVNAFVTTEETANAILNNL